MALLLAPRRHCRRCSPSSALLLPPRRHCRRCSPRGRCIDSAVQVRVRRLLINGEPLRLDRPTVAVLDTGTTGLGMCEALYCASELPLPVRFFVLS